MLGGIYHDQMFGRTWGITVINDTLLPPLANAWKVCHLNLLFL